MSTTTEQRPPQVTMAGWMVIIGSVLVVLTVWEHLSGLRSLETRRSIESFLAEPFGAGLGLDVETVIRALHVSAMVTAGLATATAVLGWHVLQRNLAARLALTVLALPLFVTGMTSGGFVSSLVAASIAMLWLSPAREWFRTGRWTPPAPPRAADAGSAGSDSITPRGVGQNSVGQNSAGPTGARPGGVDLASAGRPVPSYPPRQTAAAWPYHDRPAALVSAFVVTVVGAGLVLAVAGFLVLVMAFSPDFVATEIERQRPELLEGGVSFDQARAAVIVVGTICVSWCSAALVLAGFAMVQRGWARTALVASAAAAAVACVLSCLYVPVAIVPGVAALVTVVLLTRSDVRAWFTRAAR